MLRSSGAQRESDALIYKHLVPNGTKKKRSSQNQQPPTGSTREVSVD